MKRREAERYRKHINSVIEPLKDETALDVTDLFEPWETNTAYVVGKRVKFADNLYRCVQGAYIAGRLDTGHNSCALDEGQR